MAETESLVTPPAKMCKPSVQPLNAFAVCIQWVPPVDVAAQRGGGYGGDRGPLVRGYRLRYRAMNLDDKPIGDFVDVCETWSAETSQATLKWLQSGLAYVFEVSAFNDAGEGDWSYASEPFLMPRKPDELNGPGFAASAPAALGRGLPPLGGAAGPGGAAQEGPPLAISKSADCIELSWKPPCHRGAPIVAYDIKYSKDPRFTPATTRELSVAGEQSSVVVECLDSNTIYYFMHRARNEVGSSAWSKLSTGIATLARAPAAPAPPVRLGPPHTWQASEVIIKWEAPESDGMPIQHYHVNVARQPDMEDAMEVEIGNKVGSGTITGHTVAAPSTPRPGFSKDLYALTQLRVRGLRPNTEYYFQVRASNNVGASSWSGASLPMRTATAPPDCCGEVRFISGSCRGGIRMYWSPPDSYELPITRYDIRVSRSPTMKDAPAELSCVEAVPTAVEGAEEGDVEAVAAGPDCWWAPGAEHYCQVRAWNEAGAGEWSLVSEPMPVDPEPPAMPEAPRNFESMPTAIIVRWLAPNPLGSPITGYRLRYSHSREMEEPVEVEGLEGLETEHAVLDLQPDAPYFFQVAADNAVGEGPWSPPSQPVSVLQTPPSRMDPPFFVKRTQTTVTVGFTGLDASDPVARSSVRSYTVLYKSSQTLADGSGHVRSQGLQGFRRIAGADPAGTECDDLFPGKACEVRVLAVNDFGEGEASEPAFFETATSEPDPPRAPVLVEAEARAMTVSVLPGSDNGDPLTQFYLQVESLADGEKWEVGPVEVVPRKDPAAPLLHRVDGLIPGMSYRVSAAMENSIGRSGWSTNSEDMVTTAGEPEIVGEVQVVDAGSMSFKIKWERPPDNGGKVTKYTVAWMVDPPEEPEDNSKGRLYAKLLHRDWKEVTTTETTFKCEGCVQGCVAFAKVAAHNEVGMSAFSEPVQVTLKPDVPFAPYPPNFSQVSFTSFRVNWATLYDGGEEVTGFRIHFVETDADGRPEAARDQGEVIVDAQKTYRDLYNLCPKREYIARVAAENSVGVGPYSQWSDPKRLVRPQPPAIPGKPAFVSATVTTLSVKVQLPQGNGATVLEQVFRLSEDPRIPASNCVEISLPSHASVNKPFAPRSPPPGSAPGRRSPNLKKDQSGSRPGSAAQGEAGQPGSRTGSAGQEEDAAQGDGITEKDMQDLAALRISGEMRLKRSFPEELVFELPRLKGGTTYYVACAARNSIGLGHFGNVGGPMVTKQAAPLATTQVAFCGKDTQKVSLCWDLPDTQGSDITAYAIRCLTEEDRLMEQEEDEQHHEAGVRLVPEKLVQVSELEDPTRPSFTLCNLLPGTHYYAAVRSQNAKGFSPWVRADGSCRTDPMPPAKMEPLEPVVEERTQDSITLQWQLPDARGTKIKAFELRYINVALEHGTHLEASAEQLESVLGGQMVLIEPAGVGEELPTRHRLEALQPHSVVVAVARALNAAGAGEWSDPPCRDMETEGSLDVDCVAAPAEPSPPQAPHFDLDSLTSSSGTMSFALTSSNGALYTGLSFRLFAGPPGSDVLELEEPLGQEGQEPLREWQEEMSREELLQVLQGQLQLTRAIDGLEPGTVYAMQVRAENPVGWSPWSSIGPNGRTKPERPRSGVLLVDHSSPVSVWVKWKPPHHNGAAIKGYCVRWNDKSETLPLEEWKVIPEEELATRLVRSEVTVGALVLKMENLYPAHSYHFQFCVRNAVGTSEWSEVGTFFTRPSPPARPNEPTCSSVQSREATISWQRPDDYGSPITRYEVVCARSRQLMGWCRLVCEKLWWMPSLEVVFGLFGMVDGETDEQGPWEQGRESLVAFHAEEAFACEVDKEQTSCRLAELLPGKEYYAMVRAISAKGNGKWSRACALLTEPARPGTPQPVRAESMTCGDCAISFSMPHANGNSISEAIFAIVRVDGPLADEDVDPSTGSPHAHHARRELTLNPYVEPFESEHGEERYTCTLVGLLPGTDYEVTWACRNECGLGDYSNGTRFTTKAALPDMPESMFTVDGF